jgi:hypothetical protein
MNRIRNSVCSNIDLVGVKRMGGFMRQVFPGRRACKARTGNGRRIGGFGANGRCALRGGGKGIRKQFGPRRHSSSGSGRVGTGTGMKVEQGQKKVVRWLMKSRCFGYRVKGVWSARILSIVRQLLLGP